MAAARGLAFLGSKEHAAALGEALAKETEGPVKPMLAVAIKSVGSPSADARIAQLEVSPVADVRLMAVEAYFNSKNPEVDDAGAPTPEDRHRGGAAAGGGVAG